MRRPHMPWGSRLSRLVLWRVPWGFWAGLWLRGGFRLLRPARPSAEQTFLAGYTFDEKVVIDAGGFDGRIAWYFATRAKRVWTFEPNPHNQALILALIKRNRRSNMELVPAALGAESGEMDMTTHGGVDATGTFDPSIAASFDRTSRYSARMTTLDGFCSENAIQPDFVKIDVEGFELKVLEGAENVTSALHPDFFLEMHGASHEAKRVNAFGILDWLDRHGYKCTHVESGSAVGPADADQALRGHIFATHG
jgi:FkbM family methyltransferase